MTEIYQDTNNKQAARKNVFWSKMSKKHDNFIIAHSEKGIDNLI